MMDASPAGLCATCRWMRQVTNRRGSVFYRCGLADRDPRYARYPPLPVLTCPGYDRAESRSDAEPGREPR